MTSQIISDPNTFRSLSAHKTDMSTPISGTGQTPPNNALDQQARMKGWILEQEYYLRQNQLGNRIQAMLPSPGATVSMGQISSNDHDSEDSNFSKRKGGRDPLSHRIIEKRRRDRMNTCLSDLSRMIPSSYTKKGKGRVEKTEIVEMAIKHINYLETKGAGKGREKQGSPSGEAPEVSRKMFRLGFSECMSETLRFLVELEGIFAEDGLCLRLVNHLKNHVEKLDGGQQDVKPTAESLRHRPMDFEESPPTGSSARSEQLGFSGNGSQLRKMLESKGGPASSSSLYSPCNLLQANSPSPLTPDHIKSTVLSPAPVCPSPASVSPCPPNESNRKNYKKEIKDRFQATMNSNSISNSSTISSDEMVDSKKRLMSPDTLDVRPESISDTTSLSPFGSGSGSGSREYRPAVDFSCEVDSKDAKRCHSSQSCHAPLASRPPTVPGFALHPQGSFYVPVKLDPNLVNRFASELSSPRNGFPVLHPISISVSFPNHSSWSTSGHALVNQPKVY